MAKQNKPRRLSINRREAAKLQKTYASSRETADARNAAKDTASRAGRPPNYGPTLETGIVPPGGVSPPEEWDVDQRVLQSNVKRGNMSVRGMKDALRQAGMPDSALNKLNRKQLEKAFEQAIVLPARQSTAAVPPGGVAPREEWELQNRVNAANAWAPKAERMGARRLARAEEHARRLSQPGEPLGPPLNLAEQRGGIGAPRLGNPKGQELALRGGQYVDPAEAGFKVAAQEADARAVQGAVGRVPSEFGDRGVSGPEYQGAQRPYQKGQSTGGGRGAYDLAIRGPKGELLSPTATSKLGENRWFAAMKSPIPKGIIEDFIGIGFPSSQSKVRSFLKGIGVLGNADIPNNVAQRIANKMSAIPAANASDFLTKTANGLRKAVSVGGPKASPLGAVMEFFEVSDSTVGRVASSAGRMAGSAYKTAGKVVGSPMGGLAAFGMANALRQVREGYAQKRELNLAEILQPSAADIVQQSMLDELQMQSRMRMATKSGNSGGLSAKGLEALLGSGAEEGPMQPISLPPSSGFPVPG